MAMTDYDLSDLAAVVNGGNNDGWGGNGNGWWIILLFILLGGWGGNRGWGGNQGGAGAAGGDMLYPWMNMAQNQWQGISNIQQDLCGGFAGVTAAINNGFANAETAATARQMADMQQTFGLSQQLAQCCCDNRLATANLQSDIAREACADRQTVSDGIRDLLVNNNANTQRILDKLCDQELFAERRENENLRQQLNMANLAASQTAQTAQILQGQNNEVDALYNRLNNCPVPSMPVYGRQPIFTCQTQNNCNCGCCCN